MPYQPDRAPRVTSDTDEVIAGVIFSAEYLDCFRMFAFHPEPDHALALSYLEQAVLVAHDTLDVARKRGYVNP